MMTKPIPPKLREELDAEKYYHRCCVTGTQSGPYAKIDWHHNFTYGGKGRVNERWCILPLLKEIHDKADTTRIKEILDWIMLNRAPEEVFEKYNRSNLREKKDRLNKKYGNYKENQIVLSSESERGHTSTPISNIP